MNRVFHLNNLHNDEYSSTYHHPVHPFDREKSPVEDDDYAKPYKLRNAKIQRRNKEFDSKNRVFFVVVYFVAKTHEMMNRN